jgi:uncharacterized protein YdaU (DUF1376 family)
MEIVMHYFKRNIGDYHKKAGRLSMLEHGAYTLLMDACYDREQFPTIEQAYDWCWARTDEEKAAVRFVLEKFFCLEDGRYTQNRIQEEIDRFHKNASINSKIAQEREEKRRTNRANTVHEESTNRHLTINQEPLTNNQEPVLKPKEPKGSSSGSIPTCPHQQLVDLFHKTLPELPEVRIWNSTRESLLKARWRETSKRLEWASVQDGLEYFEKLFTWIRQSKFLMGQVNPKPGQRAFECELEWILRPQNWAKLIEGKYHAV